jgi:hypothetical protein
MKPTLKQQALVTKAIVGLREQGKPSLNYDTQQCVYRHPEGLKCIAGFALPDEEYDPSYDERGFTPDEIFFFKDTNTHKIMKALQVVHDNWSEEYLPEDESDFPELELRKVCEKYGYTYPEES